MHTLWEGTKASLDVCHPLRPSPILWPASTQPRNPNPKPQPPGRYPLLFDPQTSGGLLAGVPEGRAAGALKALQAAGYPDAVSIGTVETGDGTVVLITDT